jgi:protein TonB
MGPVGGDWVREPFFASFTVSSGLAMPRSLNETGIGIGPGVLGSTQTADANRIFKASEVNARVRVLEKPEPSYTESARKFSITGTVVLRAIFSKDGTVTNITVLRKLPHGLTKRALDAASKIKFSPALKDGQAVSTWIQLEYNFNLY